MSSECHEHEFNHKTEQILEFENRNIRNEAVDYIRKVKSKLPKFKYHICKMF